MISCLCFHEWVMMVLVNSRRLCYSRLQQAPALPFLGQFVTSTFGEKLLFRENALQLPNQVFILD